MLSSDEAGGHIILVTQGDAKTLSSAGEASIEEYEATHGITFSSILLPLVPGQKPLPFYQSIAERLVISKIFNCIYKEKCDSVFLLN